MIALTLIQKLKKNGYRVPEDVSVVGFDNFQIDTLERIGLTTYAIDTKEMSKKVVQIIVHKLNSPGYSTGVYMIAGRFIEKESAKRIGPPKPFV